METIKELIDRLTSKEYEDFEKEQLEEWMTRWQEGWCVVPCQHWWCMFRKYKLENLSDEELRDALNVLIDIPELDFLRALVTERLNRETPETWCKYRCWHRLCLYGRHNLDVNWSEGTLQRKLADMPYKFYELECLHKVVLSDDGKTMLSGDGTEWCVAPCQHWQCMFDKHDFDGNWGYERLVEILNENYADVEELQFLHDHSKGPYLCGGDCCAKERPKWTFYKIAKD